MIIQKKDDRLIVFEYGIAWGEKPNPTIENHFVRKIEETMTIDKLTPNTTYYLRPYWKCNNGLHYGELDSLTTFRLSNERIVLLANLSQKNLEFHFSVYGSDILVDWGDGVLSNESDADDYDNYKHTYTSTGQKMIVIYGDQLDNFAKSSEDEKYFYQLEDIDVTKAPSLNGISVINQGLGSIDISKNINLIGILLGNCYIKELDISKNRDLIYLSVDMNKLTKLDISNNPDLERIDCPYNKLDACTLNKLFQQLPSHEAEQVIYFKGNPGTATCNSSIAKNKGWKLDVEGDGSAKCN